MKGTEGETRAWIGVLRKTRAVPTVARSASEWERPPSLALRVTVSDTLHTAWTSTRAAHAAIEFPFLLEQADFRVELGVIHCADKCYSIGLALQQIAAYLRTGNPLPASFTVPIVREERK